MTINTDPYGNPYRSAIEGAREAELSVRKTALDMALRQCAGMHDPDTIVKHAVVFEAYLRGVTKREPAKAA